MLRVTVRGAGLGPVVIGSGESLLLGRAPQPPDTDSADAQLTVTTLALPRTPGHISRLVGELRVSDEIVRLRWASDNAAQLSSLFDAPGGARRVTLTGSMTALLDEGENHLDLLRGRETAEGTYTDLHLVIDVEVATPAPRTPAEGGDTGGRDSTNRAVPDDDDGATAPAPTLERDSREWYVALALAEPWLSGNDDYPRPPSNREIYERVLAWHGYAWNLDRPQRVDDAIRSIARLAFGPRDDPFAAANTTGSGRVQNVRFAIGRRAAEVGLVSTDDLDQVERQRRG